MFWGAGIDYDEACRDALLGASPEHAPELLEIVPADFFGRPGALDQLAERWPLLMRGSGASLGSPDGPSRDWVAGVSEIVRRARPLVVSQQLAMTRAPNGIDLGGPVPLWFTDTQLDVVVANLARLREVLSLPIALENGGTALLFEPADYEEPLFFRAALERAQCGLHLHLGGVLASARCRGIDPFVWLDRYPLERVWIVDVDLEPADQDLLFDLLAHLRGRAQVRCVVVRREAGGSDDLAARVAQARRARRVWTLGPNA